jgi:Mg2+ and Co2+ transporter CorA
MKTFTMITVAILPLSFIAALLTIPASSTPLLGHPHDFALIIITMIVTELLLILLMRLKKWI